MLRAIIYFEYIPKCIQTDNGLEFTRHKDSKESGIHLFDRLCLYLGIEYKLIKPRTPRHNGKVERSHKNDQAKFILMKYIIINTPPIANIGHTIMPKI